jgi:hypothetical protein
MTMRRSLRRVGLLALLLGPLGCEVPGNGPSETREAAGFRLRCDPGCGPEADRLLATLRAVGDSVNLWLGADPEASRSTLRIRFHSSEASFDRVDRRLTGGKFQDQWAFSHARSLQAHILSESIPDPARWARFGPGAQGERLAIHEAVHLSVYASVVDPGWPSWVSEGMAAWLEETLVDPAEPWVETRRVQRAALASTRSLPSVEELLQSDLGGRTLAERYALWARFMGVLLEPPHRDATLGFLQALAGSPPRGGWNPRSVGTQFQLHHPPHSWGGLEERLQEVVLKETGRWVEIRRASGLDAEGILQLPVRLPPLLWHRPPSPGMASASGGWHLEAEVELLGPEAGPLLLALGLTEGEGIGVLIASDGTPAPVRVPFRPDQIPEPLRLGARDGEVRPHPGSSLAHPRLRVGESLSLTLTLSGGELTLRMGKDPGFAYTWTLPSDQGGTEGNGGWGIGTGPRSAVLWRSLEMRPSAQGGGT